jgi:hypothetical protein
MAVDIHDRSADHGILHVRVFQHHIEYPFENITLYLVSEPGEYRVPFAKPLREIAPRRSRSDDPHHSFNKEPIIGTAMTGIVRLAKTMRSIRAHRSSRTTTWSINPSCFHMDWNPFLKKP